MTAVRTRWTEEIAAKARAVRDEPMPDASDIWKHIYAERT
jgi:2-oxoisovalerate dehydrogenase E1 component alpha subunit